MALTIYREREAIPIQKQQLINTNDILFDYKFLIKKPVFTADMLHIIKTIDGSEQVADSAFRTPLGHTVAPQLFSTGCKTCLNVYNYPDMIINTVECGNNALLEILKLQSGSVLMEMEPSSEIDFPVNIQLVFSDKTYYCKTFAELKRNWYRSDGYGY